MSHIDDLNALMSRVKRSGDKGSIKFVTSLMSAVKDDDKDAVKGIIHMNKGEANLVPASVTKWMKESVEMQAEGFPSFNTPFGTVEAKFNMGDITNATKLRSLVKPLGATVKITKRRYGGSLYGEGVVMWVPKKHMVSKQEQDSVRAILKQLIAAIRQAGGTYEDRKGLWTRGIAVDESVDVRGALLGEAKKMSEADILARIKQALDAAQGGDHDRARILYKELFRMYAEFRMGLGASKFGEKVEKAFTDYLATLRRINFQHKATAEEDARLRDLISRAQEEAHGVGGPVGRPEALRKAKSLVNQAKVLASITNDESLRIAWVDLNYYLRGVKVREPKRNPNQGFQGVHDPRSYGRGGLADSYEANGMSIQEDEWGGGFQSAADANREVQAGLKADSQRERAQTLKLIVQVIRGEITKQKFRRMTGRNFDELLKASPYYRNQIKRMPKKALAPVNPPAPATPTTESADIQEKVEIDGRTRAYRDTVMRLEQARKLREGRTKAMQENKFGGLYDDGSGRGAIIPAPVDYNFHEAMKIVEKYRALREKKKTLFGAPKDKMEDLDAAVAMKNGKFSMSETKMSPKQKEYRAFFAKALKKFGKDSPADMDDGEKKKFFNWIEKNWKG
jgi:hypothetical protein